MFVNTIITPAAIWSGRYVIKSQLILPAPTSNVSAVPSFLGMFNSGSESICAFVIPRAGNGTYSSTVIEGGAYSGTLDLIRFGIHKKANSTYAENYFSAWNQSRTNSVDLSVANSINLGILFWISPDRTIVANTYANVVSSPRTSTLNYRIFLTGDFNFCYIRHYRYENSVTTMIHHLLPATDGTSCGYLDTIDGSFYVVEGASVI